MCFIISIIMLVLAYNFFMAQKFLLAIVSVSVSCLFIYFMIKNILNVKKLKEERKDDN